MAIGPSLIHNGNFEQRLCTWGENKKRQKRKMVSTLMLTSMVDVFSMLVIFLLQTFSSSPEVIISKGIQLPLALTGKSSEDAIVVSLTQDKVFLDQKLVGGIKEILINPVPLIKKFDAIKSQWAKTHADVAFAGLVNLQADQNIPSSTVAQLMGIVNGQNFDRIQLAVVSGGDSYEGQ